LDKMADKKTVEKIEKEYVIPLRREWQKVVLYKRAKRAIKTIKEYLVKHMKIRDRDLNKIRIDKYLNEAIWFSGIKKPPIKIRVKAIMEGDIVRVELVDYPDKLKFKKAREEKIEKAGEEIADKKKKAKEKVEEEVEKKEDEVGKEEDKKTEKEKARAGEEVEKKLEKEKAKAGKHTSETKMKQPKRQVRKALAK